jgi:hypothetical protein
MDYTLKTIGAMHLDGDLQDQAKVMKAKGDHLKAWMQSKTDEGRQHHLKQYQALDDHFSGKKPYKPERMELSEDYHNHYIKGAHPLLLQLAAQKKLKE